MKSISFCLLGVTLFLAQDCQCDQFGVTFLAADQYFDVTPTLYTNWQDMCNDPNVEVHDVSGLFVDEPAINTYHAVTKTDPDSSFTQINTWCGTSQADGTFNDEVSEVYSSTDTFPKCNFFHFCGGLGAGTGTVCCAFATPELNDMKVIKFNTNSPVPEESAGKRLPKANIYF